MTTSAPDPGATQQLAQMYADSEVLLILWERLQAWRVDTSFDDEKAFASDLAKDVKDAAFDIAHENRPMLIRFARAVMGMPKP